VLQVDTPPPAR